MDIQFNVNDLLKHLSKARVGIIGDFCLDAYWEVDNSRSEDSVETGLPTRPVRSHRYSLGGAGNVASNLRAMGVATVSVYGVTGRDPFSYQMRELMRESRICADALLEQEQNWITSTYIKPLEDNTEANRIDLGNFNRLEDAVAQQLVGRLADDCPDLDIVIINQQLTDGIHRSELFQEKLQSLINAYSDKIFILDSRDMSERYAGTIRKINAYEAMLLIEAEVDPQDLISLEDATSAARKLSKDWGKPVFLTRGDRGCLVADGVQIQVIPGLHIVSQTDPVGAGDSMVAGIAAVLATGCSLVDAASFGNLAAGVTVQKLCQTGTASPDEIRRIGESPDYIYLPEKADDPRTARHWQDTEIEVVTETTLSRRRITHAIFDHDGTISVLREGWEKIMEPMMMRAILGPVYDSADETTYHKVLNRVRTFIDSTTGIQTLAQMQGLVKLVEGFGLVPPSAMSVRKQRESSWTVL